jgi:CheY-like chemotaxis protein
MHKVLFVDDTLQFQKIYKSKLMTEGFKVTTASNGVEALKCLAAEIPDIVLLDINMPIMDGFKVLSAMRANPAQAEVPVLVFSARGNEDEVSQAIELGANGFLVKSTTTPNAVVQRVKDELAG